MNLEWVDLGGGRCVVASPDRAWLHRPRFGQPDPFAAPMTGAGHVETTRHLLEGAIAAGLASHSAPPPPPMDALRWAWHLVSYYHLTTQTPALLLRAEVSFAASDQPGLAAWARRKRQDEAGHDRLALRDLEALGYDAEALVAAVVPPVPRAMVAAFAAAAAEATPLGVVGYAHTVERLAMTLGPSHLVAITASLPAGVDATRCLRVHSAVGSDAGHVEDNVRLVASLSAEARRRVALACLDVAAIWSQAQATGWADDAEMRARLSPFSRSQRDVEPE